MFINDRNAAGPALGLFDDAQYLTHEVPVEAGDLVLVFTDGLFKAENPKSEAFGITRLRESIRRHAGLPLPKLMQDVFSEVETFTNGQPFSDDVCVIGMEVMHLETDVRKCSLTGKGLPEPARPPPWSDHRAPAIPKPVVTAIRSAYGDQLSDEARIFEP